MGDSVPETTGVLDASDDLIASADHFGAVSNTPVERSYSTMDKTGWGHGPWSDEPDKLQWIDGETGLDCLIVRNPLGSLCGYVGVPPQHPWHKREYGHGDWGDPGRPDSIIEIHGGLTYSDSCQERASEAAGICHVPFPGRPGDVWWFGFDCAHSGDLTPSMHERYPEPGASYCTVDYVRREVANLAKQLAEVGADA